MSCLSAHDSRDEAAPVAEDATKGQRQTGGQELFRADDNLESVHGRAALRQLYGTL